MGGVYHYWGDLLEEEEGRRQGGLTCETACRIAWTATAISSAISPAIPVAMLAFGNTRIAITRGAMFVVATLQTWIILLLTWR